MSRLALLLPLALLVSAVACAERDPGREPRAAATRLGPRPERALTLRFVNPTSHELFVSMRDPMPARIEGDAGPLWGGDACLASCDPCEPRACAAPPSRVRRVGPGEALDLVWRGERQEQGSCVLTDGATSACNQPRPVPEGSYRVRLEAWRGRVPAEGPPAGPLLDVFEGEPERSSAPCVATGEIVLGELPGTFELSFVCPAAR